MRTLNRKLLRELRQTKAQSLAIGLVVASGVAVFVMSLSTWSFLRDTRDAYYDRDRFGDVFASVRRAPNAMSQRIAEIEGVAVVQTRIVSDVTLDVPNLLEPAVGRLISLPDSGEPILNNVHIRRGRWPEPDRQGEVVANDAFVEANALDLGTTIKAVMNGRLQELKIVGVALSPEYVFQVRPGELFPDDKRFGVFWMKQRQMEAAFDMDGAFNDMSLRLLHGASEQEVIEQVDRLLEPYGAVGAYGREHHVSARILDDEIKSLRATAFVAPAIFLGVAAFLLNVVLTRRIGTQRVVIAGLKAFGYSNLDIAWHYLKSSLIVALFGAAVGVLGGNWLADWLTGVYSKIYHFPKFVFFPNARVILVAVGISLLAAVVGSFRAVQTAVCLPPAEAMRPPAPANYRRSFLEKYGLTVFVPVTVRMIVRGLRRKPFNAFLSSLGIGCAVAILVMSRFGSDAIDYLIDFQFARSQRHDLQVTFYETTSPGAFYDLKQLPGVEAVEAFRTVPVKLVNGHHDHRTSIMGLSERRDLYRLLNTDEVPIRLPPAGIVLSEMLTKILNVQLGDNIWVEILDGAKPIRQVRVAGIAKEYSGTNAYMDRAALSHLLRESDVLSGAFLAVDSRYQEQLYRDLKETPRVASVSVKSVTAKNFEDTIAENQRKMETATMFFAVVIAIGVVYNTARISLEEKSRELATLRVIGFTQGEISSILLGELAVLTLVAIPIGWLIGYWFCAAMVLGFESELYRFPLVIRPASYAGSAIVTMAAAAVSGLLVHQRLKHLDLIEVLKSRE